MDGSSKTVIILLIVILVAVAASHFGILTAIHGEAGGGAGAEAPTAPGAITSITITGVGDTETHRSGGTPTCRGGTNKIKAEASISAGSKDNKIEVTAKCSLGNWSAVAEAKDPGNGTSNYAKKEANPAQGQGYCEWDYTSAGTTDSNWAVTCTF